MVPYPENKNFTPRDNPYERLSQLLEKPEENQVRIAISRLGGIGYVG